MDAVISKDTFYLEECKAVFLGPTLNKIKEAFEDHTCSPVVYISLVQPYHEKQESFMVKVIYVDGGGTYTTELCLERSTAY